MIPSATVLNSLAVAARDALDAISNWFSAISTAGWVAVAIAFLAGIWAWAVMHASTRIGPIEVDDLKSDDTTVPLVQLSAEFRRILSQVGLAPPPAVPAGSPQANLITAIEAVGTQGAAIGKLLSILPTPPQPAQYKVSAVLSGADDPAAPPPEGPAQPALYKVSAVLSGADDPAAPPPEGPAQRALYHVSAVVTDADDPAAPPPPSPSQWEVSYTVQPQNRGVSTLARTPACTDYEGALTRAAVEIYQAIAQSLPEVFPHWVRWRTPESLNDYLMGLNNRDSEPDTAAAWFKDSVDASPYNALAALQLANVNERRAGSHDGWDRVYFQAQALARYRAIAVQWPTVAAARYRASVASAELATSYGGLTDQIEREAVRAIVPFPGLGPPWAAAMDDAYVARLRDFAHRESGATMQLLNPLYTIWLKRLRNQFEPKGADRRALRKVVRTSRQCVAMRRMNALPPASDRGFVSRFRSDGGLRYRSLQMRLDTWTDLPWEARYNAACFYALRLAGGLLTDHRQRVVDCALRALARAIRESGGELTQHVIIADPDMAYFSNGGQPDAAAA